MKFMVCYYHNESEAVGQCPVCNKGLCKDCFDLTDVHICYDCAQTNNRLYKKNLVNTIIWTVICLIAVITAVILMAVAQDDTTMYGVGAVIWIVACIFPAWRLLTVRDNGTKIVWYDSDAIIVEIIFFAIKLFVVILVSVVIPVIYIVKLILAITRYKKAKKVIDAIDAHQALFVNVK